MVAMSGGVDSSVAAALLKEAGHDLTGVTMRLWGEAEDSDPTVSLAREACDLLGIEHKVLDVRESFWNHVITYFLDEYIRDLTPNPCVRCNETIKFGVLLKLMDLIRAERLATGHYARVLLDGKTGNYMLMRALHEDKDQSYFLYRLTQKQLSVSVFPLGDMTKAEVRDKARRLGLPTAEREESQEICFIPDNDYRGFIESERPDSVSEGEFVDAQGGVLGRHRGVAFYTIGQRKGLAVSSPLGRRYILDKDAATGRVTLGDEEDLKKESCFLESVTLTSGDKLADSLEAEIKLRYRCRSVKATLIPVMGRGVKVRFHAPQAGVSPGQSVVFYDGHVVIGGGVIAKEK